MHKIKIWFTKLSSKKTIDIKDIDEVGRGMHMSYLSARSLLKDVRQLLKKNSSRSLSLSVLGIEEIGKIFILAELIPFPGVKFDKEKALLIKRYLTSNKKSSPHIRKQLLAINFSDGIYPTFLDINDEREQETKFKRAIFSFFIQDFKIHLSDATIKKLNELKERGFYADIKSETFTYTQDLNKEDLETTCLIVEFVEERLEKLSNFFSTTNKAIATSRLISLTGVFDPNSASQDFGLFLMSTDLSNIKTYQDVCDAVVKFKNSIHKSRESRKDAVENEFSSVLSRTMGTSILSISLHRPDHSKNYIMLKKILLDELDKPH